MERLFLRHDEYLRITPMEYIRDFMSSVNWDSRLICIRGPKGVGKSTLLRQYIKLHFAQGDRHVLYCSADSGYFSNHSIIDTVDSFVNMGGTHLFIDEIHRYEKWSVEIKEIYDLYPGLHVVLSGSSLLALRSGMADLSRRMLIYDMPGLSFREFLRFEKGLSFPTVELSELLEHPSDLCGTVTKECRPLEYFPSYLHGGYYPFYFEDRFAYAPRVEGVVNYTIDVELPQQCGVEVGNTRKIKALIQVLSSMVPFEVDIAKISRNLGMQRLTVLQYMKYLEDANLIRRLFANLLTTGDLQKPDKILLDNSNLLYVMSPSEPEIGTVRETFFCNQLASAGHQIEYGALRNADFKIDGKIVVEVGGKDKGYRQIDGADDGYIAADGIDSALFRKIPLWAFGFLY